MTKEEAAELIESMADSLQSDATQFTLEVSMVGFQASNPGGVGFVAAPVGGAPGSTTIGMSASPNIDASQIQIVRKGADEKVAEQMKEAAEALQEVAKQLRSGHVDTKSSSKWLASLSQSVLPPVVVEVVKKALSLIPVDGVGGI